MAVVRAARERTGRERGTPRRKATVLYLLALALSASGFVKRRSWALLVAGDQHGEAPATGSPDLVIAADGGLDAARRWRLRVDAVVGDLDSASEAAMDWAKRCGATVDAHPADKDMTDLELAMARVLEQVDAVHVVLPPGGRLDHAVTNLAVLASPRWAALEVSATVGEAHVTVVRGRRRLRGEVGELLSLLAVGGPALVASTSGLLFPLAEEALSPTSGRGTSNVIVATPPTVDVVEGVVLAIRPTGAVAGLGLAAL
ncbi:MAG: thiamine diphosphokinase [Acidimicrobiaceae bacterium]|nr:thiamine diphosphokinase [Acidimicrobiaceae bacterium]